MCSALLAGFCLIFNILGDSMSKNNERFVNIRFTKFGDPGKKITSEEIAFILRQAVENTDFSKPLNSFFPDNGGPDEMFFVITNSWDQ